MSRLHHIKTFTLCITHNATFKFISSQSLKQIFYISFLMDVFFSPYWLQLISVAPVAALYTSLAWPSTDPGGTQWLNMGKVLILNSCFDNLRTFVLLSPCYFPLYLSYLLQDTHCALRREDTNERVLKISKSHKP